jgi:hypothetical protein
MKEVKLTQDKIAIVDDEDYEIVSCHKWCAQKHRNTYYAGTYLYAEGNKKYIHMHRLLMDAKKGQIVDHVNENGLDNRRDNLRFATNSQNLHNSSRTRGTSKYRGVYLRKGTSRWHSQIKVNNKRIHLGYFDTEIDAAKAHDQAALKYLGEFAKLNVEL